MPLKFISKFFLLLALLLLAAAESHCAYDKWLPYPQSAGGGPFGGSVRRLVSIDPMVGAKLLAATAGGVYYSADGGANWQARNSGLATLDVVDVAFSSANPDILLAATRYDGVYRSVDQGGSWERMTGLKDPRNIELTWFGAVAVDPFNPSRFFAATLDPQNSNYLFESTNGGTTWVRKNTIFTATRIIFTTDGTGVLYVGTADGKLWKSSGNNFVFVAGPFTTDARYEIKDFTLPGGNGQKIVVAANRAGLHVSMDGGVSWPRNFQVVNPELSDTLSNPPIYSHVSAIAVTHDPANPDRVLGYFFDSEQGVYSGLYESLNLLATTPSQITLPENGMYLKTLLSTQSSDYLGENQSGVFISHPKGTGFLHSSQGMSAFKVLGLDFAPTGSNSLGGGHPLAVSGGEILKNPGNSGVFLWDPSVGQGQWIRRSGQGAKPGPSRLIKYETDQKLWMSVEGFTFYRSTNLGANWLLTSNITESDINTNAVYSMETGSDAGTLMAATEGTILHSFDGGLKWYAGTGLNGSTWMLSPDVGVYGGYYGAGSQSGLFRTNNYGVTWTKADNNYFSNKTVSALAASTALPGHLLVGTYYFGLYESFDHGATFQPVEDQSGMLPLAGNFGPIAVADVENDILAAANVYGDGIYITGDGGLHWSRITEGVELADFTVPDVGALAFTPDGKALVAGFSGLGLYYLELPPMPEITTARQHSIFAARTFTLDLTAVDPAGSPLTIALVEKPANSTFAGNTFTFTPTSAQVGTHELKVTLSNGFYTRPYTFTINVLSPNNPPVFTPIADQSATVGDLFNLALFATDPDGGAVTFDGLNMPAGASIQNGNIFTWTPFPFQNGLQTVTFLASDGKEITSEPVLIDVNTKPALQPVGDANGRLKAVAGNTLTVSLTGYDADAGDNLFYYADGVNLGGPTYQFYTETPGLAPVQVAFTIRDSKGAYGNTVSAVIETDPAINANLPPVIDQLPPMMVNLGEEVSFRVTTSEPNGQVVSLLASGLPSGADFASGTGVFSWTPLTYTPPVAVTFTARDLTPPGLDANLYDHEVSSVVAITVNRPPTISPVPLLAGLVGQTLTHTVTGQDPDGEAVRFLAENLPPWADINETTGRITWAVHQMSTRNYQATVYAYDASGNYSTTAASFVANRAPALAAIGAKTVMAKSQLSFTIDGDDPDGDALTYSAQNLPEGALFDAATREFSWTPAAVGQSPYSVTFRVQDAYGAVHSETVTITVTPKPAPPSSGGGGGGGGGCFLSSLGG